MAIGSGIRLSSRCGPSTGSVARFAFDATHLEGRNNDSFNDEPLKNGKTGSTVFTQPPCRFGPLFTDFNRSWQTRATSEWIQDCLGAPPNPLAFVQGVDVAMLSLSRML